jgi:hypothetical protein
MIWEYISLALGFAIFITLTWCLLKLLFKYNEKMDLYVEKIIFKKNNKFREMIYPQIHYKLIVEEFGVLYSVYSTREDAEKVLKSMPFLTIRPFGIHAEEIDPETKSILKWKTKDGFSLWIKPNCKQNNS